MQLLLDTHSFLWYIGGNPQLSAAAKALIHDPNNAAFLSIASIWEMAIKHSTGKLTLAQPFQVLLPGQLHLHRIKLLPIEVGHLQRVALLPFHHKDPFDRMLVAQCEVENLPLVSRDTAFDAYGIQRLW